MPRARVSISVSLDGFCAGPDQSVGNPLGIGGEALHEWAVELAAFRGDPAGLVNESTTVLQRKHENVGAFVMGRNMFGPVRGDWGDGSWNGWWGEEPPYHAPVFVLTHHAREPIEMLGGTTFHFVTDGVESAVEQAIEAAGGKDIEISGGATCVQQCLRAGLVDEITLSIVPLLLGDGARLLDGAGAVALVQKGVIEAPGVTHVTYDVSH